MRAMAAQKSQLRRAQAEVKRLQQSHTSEGETAPTVPQEEHEQKLQAVQEEVRKLQAANAELRASVAAGQASAAQLETAQTEAASLRSELQRVKDDAAKAADAASTALQEKTCRLEATSQQLADVSTQREVLEAQVEALQAELHEAQATAQAEAARATRLEEEFNVVDAARSALQEEVLDLRGAVRVMVRVRPRLGGEVGRCSVGGRGRRGKGSVVPTEPQRLFEFPHATEGGVGPDGTAQVTFVQPAGSVARTDSGASAARKSGAGSGRTPYSFNAVFAPTQSNGDVFRQVSHIVASAMDGRRACIFAYGQTGSGKTHTMLSREDGDEGLIPRAVQQVFERAGVLGRRGWDMAITAEMLEVYNEQVRDLLSGMPGGQPTATAARRTRSTAGDAAKLDICLDPETGETCVPGLTRVQVGSWEDVHGVLERAASARSTGATASNAASSRSHCVFTLRVTATHSESGQNRRGVLNLVDLAGSERLGKSGATGERLKETQKINKSLSALGSVLSALGAGDRHVPFRNSKLTHLLSPCLADTTTCRTLMIATLSPTASDAHESQCTLRFAAGVAAITAPRAKK